MIQDTGFYQQVLGLTAPLFVSSVDLSMADNRVIITVEHQEGRYECPMCKKAFPCHDCAPNRRWRDLNTCQLKTIIESEVPRTECPDCHVKTLEVPWAKPHERFILLMEAFCLKLLQASENKTEVPCLLGLCFDEVHGIEARAVKRGLDRRGKEPIRSLGIHWKSMNRGHHYFPGLCNLGCSRIINFEEHRTMKATSDLYLRTLSEDQRKSSERISMDIWDPFIRAIRDTLPRTAIVHDRFHVSKRLNDSVDKTRRAEHRGWSKEKRKLMKGSRCLFLWNAENLSGSRAPRFADSRRLAQQTVKAWECNEMFSPFGE